MRDLDAEIMVQDEMTASEVKVAYNRMKKDYDKAVDFARVLGEDLQQFQELYEEELETIEECFKRR